jgi:hypothetical protein
MKKMPGKNNPYVNKKQIKDRNYTKNINCNLKKSSKTKEKIKSKSKAIKNQSIKSKYYNILNIEDSSTNCLSRNNYNKRCIALRFNLNSIYKQKENLLIPLLITKESEESLFINYKLAKNDTITESTLRSDFINYNLNNLKLNKKKKKYDHCNVDENIGKNENDSLELYDFSVKENVDYVLTNFSALSYSNSNKDISSINLDDCNEEENGENKKFINKIKIFSAKKNLSKFSSKIKGDNFNNKKLII